MKTISIICLLFLTFTTSAQDDDIVKIVDDLTIEWDKEAVDLRTYKGLKFYCSTKYNPNKIDIIVLPLPNGNARPAFLRQMLSLNTSF